MNKAFYITLFLLLLSVGLNVYQHFRPKDIEYTEIIVKDTIVDVIRNYDTVYLHNTVYKDVYHYDTLYFNNTIYIKDTVNSYIFREKEYDLSIRAMRLDNYKLDIHAKDTVRIVEKETFRVKEKPFSFGIGLGYGGNLHSGRLEPFVGVTVQYKLLNF